MNEKAIEAALRAWFSSPWGNNDPHDGQLLQNMRAAISAYEAALWQPIETAPIDGTPIIVGHRPTGSMRWAVWSEGFWRDGQDSADGRICGCPHPTDWRPLSAPPKD